MQPSMKFASLICLLLGCGTLVGNPESTKPGKGAGGGGPVSGQSPTAQEIVNGGIEEAKKVPFEIHLTDAPLDEIQKVIVQIVKLEISSNDGAWTDIPVQLTQEVDLLSLQDGASLPLASMPDLPAGSYQKLRIVLSETNPPYVIDKAGERFALKVPTGMITADAPFDHSQDSPASLTIDFDVRKSIKYVGGNKNKNDKPGRYQMRPYLRVVKNQAVGSIVGEAKTGSIVCIYPTGSVKDESDDCDGAITSAISKKGKFKAAFIPPGSYSLRIFSSDGYVDHGEIQVVVGGESVLEN